MLDCKAVTYFDGVVVEFVPPCQGCQSWAWKFGNRTEQEAIDGETDIVRKA